MQPNQISHTAAFIAIKFYGLTHMQPYRSWFDDEVIHFYNQMVQFLPSPLSWYYTSLKKGWLQKLFIFSEELLLPGDLMHIIVRKYFISQKVRESLDENYEQMLVLGAGFDHLATFHARRGIPAFEIEAPRMASIKRNFLEEQGWQHPDLHIIANHRPSEQSVIDLMGIKELDPTRNTLVVAEGFFDYLSPGHARTILQEISSYFSGNIRLISTVFALDELAPFRRAVFKMGVRMVNEQIRLGLSKSEFDALIASTGFQQAGSPLTAPQMKERLLEPNGISMPVLEGFYLTAHKKAKFLNNVEHCHIGWCW